MAIERLTAEDRLMLWPDDVWPQDIGALVILDGRRLLDPAGRFRIDPVMDAIASRLHLVPRFRQLLRVPPRIQGLPLWVDAPDFELAHHVGVLPLPAPGDEAQLLLITELLRGRRLDRSRPLWEMWFLTGMPEQRVGLFVRMHHCIGDGIAGVATLANLLDVSPDVTPAPPQPWTPAPPPAAAELIGDNLGRRLRALRMGLVPVAHPAHSLRGLVQAWPAMRELVPEGAAHTSLDHRTGRDRALALVRSRIDVLKDVAHAYDAKVNDVLLAAIAGGLRRLLAGRGEAVEQLPVYVPLSLRRGQYAGARGNDIAQMVVPIPMGAMDPVERLRRIAKETAVRKARSRPSLGNLPTGRWFGPILMKIITSHPVNVTTADIPGPEFPLYLAGAQLLDVFPVLPLIGTVSLGVGAISYAGQFNIGAVADKDAYMDIEVFAAGVRDELDRLAVAMVSGTTSATRR